MNDQSPANTLSYRDAGVDIDAGNTLVQRIKPLAAKTMRPEVLGGIGGFGALVEISRKYRNPVLVSSTDGVGTKLRLAFELRQHNTIGIDLVAMSVNDIVVQGAEPLFFLDYFACGKLDVNTATQVVEGIAAGCEMAGCALVGGETAEMPGMYPADEYDLAGFAVGIVEKDKIVDGTTIKENDIVLGLASSGPHSNGYSLIRRILEKSSTSLQSDFHGRPLHEFLMAPTRIYVKPLLALMGVLPIKGMAHITGGGLLENIPRILSADLCAVLEHKGWALPPVFEWLQITGNVPLNEMHRTFNCGVGMVLVISPEYAKEALQLLHIAGEQTWQIGTIRKRNSGGAQTIIQ